MPAVNPLSAPPTILTFTSAHSPLTRSPTAAAPSLPNAKQHSVVVNDAVIGRVEDVSVQPVLIRAKVQDAQAHFLRRTVGHWHIRPASGIRWRSAGEWRLTGKASRMIELQAKGGDEGRIIGRADVIGGNAATGEEAAVVNGRPVDDPARGRRPTRSGRPSCRRARRPAPASRPAPHRHRTLPRGCSTPGR